MKAFLDPRVWLALTIAAALAWTHWGAYRQGGATARTELAEYKATQAEAGRLAMQQREREQAAAREREATWQAQYDQGAKDGQKARDTALADAGRAQSALDRVRRENGALRAALRGAAADPGPGGSSATAGGAAGVSADLLERLGARIERLGGRAGVYARFADEAHAAGNTCERSADALSAPPGVTLFPR